MDVCAEEVFGRVISSQSCSMNYNLGPEVEKFVFGLTGPYLTRRATIGRLELPLWQGAVRWTPPTCHPHKYNGQYGPGFIELMTPGDTLPQPNCVIDPFFAEFLQRLTVFGNRVVCLL